jgi:hypothetical protein
MIRDKFNDGDIVSVDFGASLRGDNRLFFVPADVAVQNSLKGVLRNTVEAFDHIDGDWQEFDVSEDYGEARRVFAHRNSDLMGVFSAIYDAGALDELADLVGRLSQLEYYFAAFRDRDGRKAVGIKKATQFQPQRRGGHAFRRAPARWQGARDRSREAHPHDDAGDGAHGGHDRDLADLLSPGALPLGQTLQVRACRIHPLHGVRQLPPALLLGGFRRLTNLRGEGSE